MAKSRWGIANSANERTKAGYSFPEAETFTTQSALTPISQVYANTGIAPYSEIRMIHSSYLHRQFKRPL